MLSMHHHASCIVASLVCGKDPSWEYANGTVSWTQDSLTADQASAPSLGARFRAPSEAFPRALSHELSVSLRCLTTRCFWQRQDR